MNLGKIILCGLLIFFVTITSGCGGAIKGAIKSAGKGASKFAKNNADIVVDVASYAMSDNNKPVNNRPSGNITPSVRPNAKTGAMLAGSAMVAEELISDNNVRARNLNAGDLSLGKLSIDDRAEKAQSLLGNPNSVSTDSDGGKRLKYQDMEVVLHGGKITALVSLTSKFSTPRGIRQGSTDQEVFKAYGIDYERTAYDNMTLYEYVINSYDGHPCYLRFAVRNSDGRVEYISERFVQ